MAHDEEFQLFDQCNLCIVCSKSLSSETAQQLATTVSQNSGETFIVEEHVEFENVAQFTHIISNTIDFKAYETACDALIPVVKPQWVQTSLAKNKLANPRQHSPDPRLFLNDVVVTCGDIPEGDKDAIIGGVVAKGGLYSPRVTLMVTHLVDLSADSDKARLVKAKKLNIKVVLPHWFDDCLKLGRRIIETPYLLPDPEILRAGPNVPIQWHENKDLVGASTPDPSGLPTSSSRENDRSVFEGKRVQLSSDLGIGHRLQESIEAVIEHGGGTVTSNVYDTDILICRFREGVAYRTASRLHKEVGNLAWLYRLMTFNTYTSPLRRLLHYPVDRSGIPEFKGLKISLSNYVGEARIYLENLIAAAGAECTKTLKQDNTHLITAHGNSEKCSAAREWGLEVVNHLWLEESYAKWKMLPTSDPRYSHFPLRTNLGEVAGQTRLNRDVLEQVFFPSEDTVLPSPGRPVMQNKDQNTTSIQPPPKGHSMDEDIADTTHGTPQTKGKSRRLSDTRKTPARSRLIPEGKENDTPSSTSSRRSKDAATARLHEIAPDIALYEKEKKRVGGVVYGGRRKSDEDRVPENKKRRSVEAQDESDGEQTDSKRQKKSRPPIAMHLLITGYQKWVGNMKKEDADKRHLRDLGVMVVQDARRCTHLAAPSILRTPKFVNALAYAPVIVNIEYITSCLKKNELLNPAEFPLKDQVAETKFGFSLAHAAKLAKKNKNKLLQGYRIYCVESIRGGFEAFQSIAQANGGECSLFRGRLQLAKHSRREESDDEDSDMEDEPVKDEVFLLSSLAPEHTRLWPRFRQVSHDIHKTPRIVRVDWLLDMAMSQETRAADDYELTEEMAEMAGKADEMAVD
ncbi:hypothetical protein N7510_008922 [Penicillium lagena]|uniref:uncharacterized protein n=1 Tax=Penicillium lagena TaxID=94218 RepID=UPI0025403E80|nr:uncharacterized protein N7510_008922 [Penicillium lagena]KAJ5606141.1 hypothetical protein N7510_008922 [Penicillium lagena]